MGDVGPESAPAAALRIDQCFGESFAMGPHTLAHGKEHLGERHLRREPAEEKRGERPAIADTEEDSEQAEHEGAGERRQERSPHLLARCASPRQRRTNAHDEEQGEPDR